ncbi:MAG: hypothetical protein LAP85_06350 [Acidobacteriia bacterium]|nr:hypothetical protein [Terriglobia bacterium]
MPHLVGIWSPESSEQAISACLAKQLERIRIPKAPGVDYLAVYPGFGMAIQDPGILENGPQPAKSEDGRFALLLDGEIWNSEELSRQFRRVLPPGRILGPELCLRLFMQQGTEALHLFNGVFCIVLYDCKDRRLTICTDRYGFRSVFYVRRANTLLFATELKALAAVDPGKRVLDDVGILESYCYGTHFMERTWLEGYWRLPPASILSLSAGEFNTRTYWIYRYDEASKPLDQPTCFTVYGKLLDRAVERCMRGSRRIGIFLSGGYDSRAVAACIRSHHLPLPAFTFGHPSCRDVRFAGMLAEKLGLEHHALTDQGPYLFANCPSIVWRTEGLTSFAVTTSIRYHAILKEHMDIFLTGFLGEFGGSHTWPQLLMARTRGAAMAAIFNRYVAPRLTAARRIFDGGFLKTTEEALRSRFSLSFEKVSNDRPLNIADAWNLINLQPFSTWHTTSIDRYLLEVRPPHLDFDLVEFLLTIPPRARLEQRIYKKMIAYSFPAIRHVPCTNDGLPINPNFPSAYAGMTLRFIERKVLAHVSPIFSTQPSLGRESQSLADDLRSEPDLITKLLNPLLKQGVFPSTIFDHKGIKKIVSEHYERGKNHEAILARLISWALAARYFYYDDLAVPPALLETP